jgi:hypothetical protein
MGYDLLIAGDAGTEIVSVPFYWLARPLAAIAAMERGVRYLSITRGRHDIIWRRDQSERTGA